MIPHANKYGAGNSRKDLIEKRKQQKREQMVKQKEAELKAAILLAIVAISIQSVAFIFTFMPSIVDYTILPGLLGLLIGGMAIGLVHSDKKKKTFVTIIFTINVIIGVYSGYVFIKSQQPQEVTEEELQQYNTFNSKFQEIIKDSLQAEKASQNDTAVVE